MITQQNDREIIKSGAFREQHFKLAQNAHIFKILRDGIYSDKPLAVIREYWANARDEHVKLGKPELPVDVTLPSFIDPYLKIRDYGKGLSRQDVEDIFISYGTSTKTDSNDYIGALGIGSKSAFCYTSAFQITSYVDGKAHVYSCYIDETEMGKIAYVNSTPSDEPTGVEISIPINSSDFYLFQTKVKQLFMLAKHRPNIKGQPGFVFDEPEVFFSNDSWKFLSTSYTSYCVMGDVPYAFDVNTFINLYPSVVSNIKKEERVRQEVEVEEGKRKTINVNSVITYPDQLSNEIIRLISHHKMALYFNIGDLEIAASREALSYKTKTVLAIYNKICNLIKELQDLVQKDVEKCKNLYEAKKLWSDYFGHDARYSGQNTRSSILYDIGYTKLVWNNEVISNSHITWSDILVPLPKPAKREVSKVDKEGKPLSDKEYDALVKQVDREYELMVMPLGVTCMAYERNGYRKLHSSYTTSIDVSSSKDRYIINDTGRVRGVFSAINALMPRDSYNNESYYIFEIVNAENRAALEKFFNESGVPVEYLSKIDIPKVNYPTYKTSPKNSKKFFIFNGKDDVDKDSDRWDIVDIDPEEEEGVYVIIDRYIPQFSSNASISALVAIKSIIEEAEKTPITIYGVKTAAANKLGNNWTKVEDYCVDIIRKTISEDDFEQMVVDTHHLNDCSEQATVIEVLLGIYNRVKEKLPANSKLESFYKPLKVVIENHKKYNSYKQISVALSAIGKKAINKGLLPSANINEIERKFMDTYPMLQYAIQRYGYLYSAGEKQKFYVDSSNYVVSREKTVDLSQE